MDVHLKVEAFIYSLPSFIESKDLNLSYLVNCSKIVTLTKDIFIDLTNHTSKMEFASNCTEIRDKKLGNLVVQLKAISHIDLLKINSFNANQYFTYKNNPKFGFSQRLARCLYYLLRRKTVKEIASLSNLSFRGVIADIERIQHRLSCRSRSETLQKSIALGFLEIIPLSSPSHICRLVKEEKKMNKPLLPQSIKRIMNRCFELIFKS